MRTTAASAFVLAGVLVIAAGGMAQALPPAGKPVKHCKQVCETLYRTCPPLPQQHPPGQGQVPCKPGPYQKCSTVCGDV